MNVVLGILSAIAALMFLELGTDPDRHLRQSLHRVVKELIALVVLVLYASAAVGFVEAFWPGSSEGEVLRWLITFFVGGVLYRIYNAVRKPKNEACRCGKVHEKSEEE